MIRVQYGFRVHTVSGLLPPDAEIWDLQLRIKAPNFGIQELETAKLQGFGA